MDIAQALKAIAANQTAYRKAERYYAGDHDLAFATRKFRNAFGRTFAAFADNLCALVVDTLVDRLLVTGFTVETEREADNARIAAELMRIWQRNRMDLRAGETHREASLCGDAYLIVWPDAEGFPIFYPNRARHMAVQYDDETPGLILSAAKLWTLPDGRQRLTLYHPDRIEKHVTRRRADATGGDLASPSASAFEPFETEREAWPLPNPWSQVPVFHFANNTSVGQAGRSELADVIPNQDALNKTNLDKLIGQEYVALPQRWMTGVEIPIDEETGKPLRPFEPAVDQVWAAAAENARFGQFPGADLSQLEASAEGYRKQIATVSRTPLHYITPPTGEWPSGEALKTAEAAFVAKARQRTVAYGNVWEDALQLAYKMLIRQPGAPDVPLSCVWQSVEPRLDVVPQIQALTNAGAELRAAARFVGVSDEQADVLAEIDIPGVEQ